MPSADDKNSIKLSLLENSHAFLKEAVVKAIDATTDIRQLQFAILNVVQSLELSLKAALNEIHPAFIYENIDTPKYTVNTQQALQRLENPAIGNVPFSSEDKKKIGRAIKARNEITHADINMPAQHAAMKFIEIFAFVSEFQQSKLNTAVSDLIPEKHFVHLLNIQKLSSELVSRAEERIAKEKIHPDFIRECPNCCEQTFVIEDGIEICYTCMKTETITVCPHCNEPFFESDLESFFGDIDSDYCEGRIEIHNSYGYSDFDACPSCLTEIRRKIQTQRAADDEYHYRRMEDEYSQSRRPG